MYNFDKTHKKTVCTNGEIKSRGREKSPQENSWLLIEVYQSPLQVKWMWTLKTIHQVGADKIKLLDSWFQKYEYTVPVLENSTLNL